MARTIKHRFGQLAALAGAVTVLMSGLIAVAIPAPAATAPPWHWSQVTGTASLTWYSSKTVSLACPAGYVPVSGGFAASDGGLRLKGEHADLSTNQFVFDFGNSTGVTQTAGVSAWCVLAGDLAALTTTTAASEATTSSSHGAVVTASCPGAATVVGVDAQWASTGTRTLDLLGPEVVDASKWHVTGTSATVGDVLTLTMRCAAFETPYWDMASASSTSGAATATCPAGTRVLNGGAYTSVAGYNSFATSDSAYLWASSATRTTWSADVHWGSSGMSLTVVVECISTNVPAVALTSAPPNPSNAASGQIVFTASDPFGQSVTVSCALDGLARSCSSGSPVSYGPLGEGSHTFSVDAVNQDGEHTVANHYWQIDLTPPTVASTSPGSGAPLDATFVAVFSEQMAPVTTSTFQVLADGDAQPLAGSVATTVIYANCPSGCTKATFTPTAPLAAHQTYTATLTGDQDQAGNPLVTTSWQVQTINHTPSCTDVAAGTTAVNASKPVSLTCSDEDGDALTYAVVAPPSHGQLSALDATGSTTYSPDPGYVGADSFTYAGSDGFGGTSPETTVTITVGPDHAPVCGDVAVQLSYQSSANVPLSCSDVDTGQPLSYLVDAAPSHGGLGTMSGDGKVTYTPNPGFSGVDTFTYHANDGYGDSSAVQTVTLYVATDAPPTCVSKTVSVLHATAVSIPLSCSDPDTGQTLTLFIATSPSHGSLSMTDPTHVRYKPSATFGGTDSFTYKASDGQGGQSPAATVTLKVAPGATVLSLKAGTLTLVKGKSDRLTGRLRDKVTGAYVNGRTVLLQFRRSTSSSWSTVARTVTARIGTLNGVARFTVKPSRNCYYRVVFRGSSAYRSSASSAVHIRVT